MKTHIRRATREDIDVLGRFVTARSARSPINTIFRTSFPSPEAAVGVISSMITNPGFYGIVAEVNGRIAGSNFMDERATIAGIGPISVDPEVQNSGAGRAMMQHMLDRVAANRMSGRPPGADRISQSLFQPVREARLRNPRTAIGNDQERRSRNRSPATQFAPPLMRMSPHAIGSISMCMDTNAAANCATPSRLGRRICRASRRITGYATAIGYGGYAVGESNNELKALISAATSSPDAARRYRRATANCSDGATARDCA